MERPLLNIFQQYVLLALLVKGPNAFGIDVWNQVKTFTGRDDRQGAVYTTLKRLERHGYVDSEDGRGGTDGRPKKRFSISPTGAAALSMAREALQRAYEQADPSVPADLPLAEATSGGGR